MQQFAKTQSGLRKSLHSATVYCALFLFSILYAGNGFATVYNVTNTADGLALNQLRGAILAADAAGPGPHTINVAAGTYTLTLGEITFGNNPQTINIVGAGSAVTIINMTSGAGKDRIFFINPSGGTNSPVISVSGLTFQNGSLTSDLFGGAGICAGGGSGESLTVTNCVFNNNFIPVNAYGGAAICMQVRGNLTVDNCTFTNNVSNDADGGAILFIPYNSGFGNGQGNLSVTNSTFTGNSVNIPGPTNSNGGALAFTGPGGAVFFSVTITNNTFINNSADGYGGAISANNSPNLNIPTINYNRFVGNTSGVSATTSGMLFVNSSGSVNADNNWWGCNTGPTAAGACDKAAGVGLPAGGSLIMTKWLQLKTSASPSTICNTAAGLGNTSTVTASFNSNNLGDDMTGNVSRLIGLPVTWSSNALGSTGAPQTTTIQSGGTATTTFTANLTGGGATVNAQVDNVPSSETSPARALITVNTKPTVTTPANAAVCITGGTTFTSTITGTPAPTLQWYKGATPLVNNATYSGVGTATLTITNAQLTDGAADYNVQATNSCGTTASGNITFTVNPQPVGPTLLAKTPNLAAICTGTGVSATFNSGTGGTGCSDDYTVSIDGGAAVAYTPGNTVGASATTSIVIQGRRAACTPGAGCTGTSYVTLASWTVNAQPVGPTLLAKTPNLAAICTGTGVSATFNSGTGGTGCSDDYTVSIDGGAAVAYTPGNTVGASATTSIVIQGRRAACTAGAGCTGTSYVTLASWTVNAQPVGPTLLAKTPNLAAICTGTGVSATFNSGTGGTGCSDDYTVSIDGGAAVAYTPGNTVGASATTSIVIQGRRAACTAGAGCTGTSYVTLASWTVNAQPVGPTLLAKTPNLAAICTGTGVSATFNSGTGGTGCSDDYTVSIDGGAAVAYTPGNTVGASATTSIVIQGRRAACTPGAGCTGTSYVTLASWTVNAQPVGPTLLAKTPNLAAICTGTGVSATFNSGTGGTGCSDDYTVSIDGGAAVAYTPGNTVGASATTSIVIQGRRAACTAGAGCTGTSYVTLASWTVNAQPVGPTLLAKTPNLAAICTGTGVSATFNSGTGGTGCSDDYTVSIDGGAAVAYTPGNTVGASATTSIVIQGRRAACTAGAGCTGTSYVTLASWTVNAQPVGPTLLAKTPNLAAICTGTGVSATFNSGTGGTGCSDDYTVSIDGGAAVAYTPGNTVGASATTSIVIQGRRAACTAGAGCTGTSYVTLASWTVNAQPVGPTLLAKTPNTATVCSGTGVSATFNSGTGGTGCLDDYTISINGGAAVAYTPGSTVVVVVGGTGSVVIQGRRANCSAGSGCTGTSYVTLASWIVNVLPTVSAPTVTQPTCGVPSGTIVVNASGSGTLEYSINNGVSWVLTNSFSGLAGGNYTVLARLQTTPACSTPYASNPVVINSAPLTPVVNVKGNGNNIAAGSLSPAVSNNTDFGASNVGTPVTKVYTIQNLPAGTATLNIGTITITGANAGMFTVTALPSTPVAVGNSTTFSVTFNPSSIGLKTATVNIPNDACINNPYTFAIQGYGCNITPTINGVNSTCLNSVRTYTTEAGKTNYVWTILGGGGVITAGGTATDDFVTVNWNGATGTSQVRVFYDGACVPTLYNVQVNPLPTPGLSGLNLFCAGTSGLTYTTEAIRSNYIWTVSGGTIASGGGTSNNTATVNWDLTPTGSISVNYTDANGCTAASPTVLNVTKNPLPVPVISGPTVACAGSTGNIYTTSGAGSPTGYTWTVSSGGTIVGATNTSSINVTWTTSGSKTVTVTFADANGCTPLTPTSYAVTVNPVIAGNTIAAAQTICSGQTPATIGSVVPTGGSGTYVYAWESSLTGGGVGFGPASGTNNALNYSPGALTQTTYYRRTVTSGTCSSTSNEVQITVNPVIAGNTIAASQTICSGQTPAGLTGSLPTGGNGTYTYLWESSTTAATGPWSAAGGTNNTQNYAPGALTQTTWYRRTVNSGPCQDIVAAGSTVQITVNPLIAGNTIAASQSICSGQTPTALTGSLPTGGNGTYTYVWEQSTTAATGPWSAAAGANTNQNYAPGALTQTTWYRRTVNSGTCQDIVAAGGTVQITVNPLPTLTSTLTPPAICSGQTFSYTPTSNPASGTTFNWNRATVAGITPAGPTAGTGNPNEALTNTTPNPITVTYVYTVTITATNCVSSTYNVQVVVNPSPKVFLGTTFISSTLSLSDPTYNRPVGSIAQGGGCGLSGVGTAVHYKTHTFTLATTSNVRLSLLNADGGSIIPTGPVTGGGPDSYLSLYNTAGFVPGAACTNLVATSDDAGSGFESFASKLTTTIALAPGTYTAVVATFDNTPSPNVFPWNYTLAITPIPVSTSQTVCGGSATAAVNFASPTPTAVVNWTNDNNTIGLASSGSGTSIGSFTAVNNGTTVQTANISLTATANGCTGPATTYTYTVNPRPKAAITSPDITICAGTNTNIAITVTASGAWSLTLAPNGQVITGTGNTNVNVALSPAPADNTITTYTVASLSDALCTSNGTDFTGSMTVTKQGPVTAGTIGGNQTVCEGVVPAGLTNTVSGTGTGTISYRWEMSVSPFTTWTTVVGATGATYAPPALFQTTQFRRITISTTNLVPCESTPSAFVTVTITPSPKVIGATGGGYVCGPTLAPITFYFSGTPPFNFTIRNNTDLTTFSVNNNPGNSFTFTPTTQGIYQVIAMTDATGCAALGLPRNDMIITKESLLLPGITPAVAITTNIPGGGLTICNTVSSIVYKATPNPTSGTKVFQWYKNGNLQTGGSISTTTYPGDTYTDNAPSNGDFIEVYYTADNVANPCIIAGTNPATSSVTITKLPALDYGTVASGNETLCVGGDPANIALSAAPTGSGSFTYQWYSKDGTGIVCPTGSSTAGWTLIGGATSASYDPAAASVPANTTRVYAVLVTPAATPTCGAGVASFASGCRTVTVLPVLNYGTVSGNETICINTVPTTPKTVTGTTGSGSFTYQWYYNNTGLPCPSGSTIPSGWTSLGVLDGANTATYTAPSSLAVTTRYAVYVTPTGVPTCGVGAWAGCATVIVGDFTPPVITCAVTGNSNKNTNTGVCTYTAVGAEFNSSATDNCAGTITYSYTLSGATVAAATPFTAANTLAGVAFNKGVTTVSWTAKDISGNVASCSFTVTVTDIELPVLSCKTAQSRNTNLNVCSYAAVGTEFDLNSFGDNCPGSTIKYVLTGATTGSSTFSATTTLAGVAFNKGVTTVQWIVNDAVGNTANCSFTVTVTDIQSPSITCQPGGAQSRNTNLNLCTWLSPNTNLDATATDNCPGITYSYVLTGATTGTGTTLNGVTFNKGVTNIAWTATDASSNTATCNFNLTVVDNQLPVISCIAPQTRNAGATCTYTAVTTEFDPASFSDNCPGSTVSYSLSGVTTGTGSGSLVGKVFNKGVTTVTWTVTDASNNIQTCSFTVTVQDVTLPVVSCPVAGNVNRNTGAGVCTYTVSGTEFDATATDNCPGPLTFSYSLSGATTAAATAYSASTSLAGVLFNKGITTVTWTAKDVSGNISTSCSFTVTVIDNQPPVITCKIAQTRNAGASCTYTAVTTEFDPATVSDNCSTTVTYTLTGATTGTGGASLAGVVFQKGATTVTWSVTDGTNAAVTCSFTVTVNDVTAPVITCVAPQSRNTNSGVCTYTAVGTEFNATATDNCPGPFTFSYTLFGATTGTGSTLAGKVFNKGVTTVQWDVKDAANNTSSCSFTVTVVDNQPPAITCPANIITCYTGVGASYTVPALIASDNCGITSTTYTVTGPLTTRSGSGNNASGTFDVGLNTIVWTVSDGVNTSTCSTTVTIKPVPTAAIGPVTQNVCQGSPATMQISLTGTSPWTVVYHNSAIPVPDVTITITAPGGPYLAGSPYVYNLVLTPSGNTTYTIVSVNDAVGCPGGPVSGSAAVVVKPLPTATILAGSDQTICQGSSATIPIVMTGSPTYTLVYSDGTSNTTLTGISSPYNLVVTPTVTTTYTLVSVQDAVPCYGVVFNNAVITVNPTTVGGTVTPATNYHCSTTNSGTLTLSGQVGTVMRWEKSIAPFTTWTTIANTTTTLSYSNLAVTTRYRAVVQSGGGGTGTCPAQNSAEALITVAPMSGSASVTSAYNGQQISCIGSTDGIITVTGSGGTGALTYTLSGGTLGGPVSNGTGVFSGLGAGVYSWSVKDALNCTGVSGTVTITAPTPVVNAFVSQVNVSCFGGLNGSFTVSATGGAGVGYSYTIVTGPVINTSGITSGVFTGLKAGTYTVTAKDGNNCLSNTVTITLTQPASTGSTPDLILGNTQPSGTLFTTSNNVNYILYNITNKNGTDAALNVILRASKVSGYTFDIPNITSITIGATTYSGLDNPKWTTNSANPFNYFFSLTNDPSGNSICGGATRTLLMRVTHTTSSIGSFAVTGTLLQATGEVAGDTPNNTAFSLFTAEL